MTEHPILFNSDMVRAILGGRKTQTRRVIKMRDGTLCQDEDIPSNDGVRSPYVMDFSKTFPQWQQLDCPYGQPGDRLWVRETHVFELYEDEPRSKDGRPIHFHAGDGTEFDESYWLYPHYRATDPTPELCYEDGDGYSDGDPQCKWRPSIHMPRWASRITLEIVNVRVERVQEIGKPENDDDIFAEGLHKENYYETYDDEVCGLEVDEALDDFIELWDSINSKRGFGWDVNPWVWVIEFERILEEEE